MAGGGIPERGILAVDKECGPTSHDVVARLRRLLGIRRIGHCGTLDPLATGVLVTCFGRYTRLADWISAGEKEYEATFLLGADSDTGDAEGPLRPRDVPVPPTPSQIEAALEVFRGAIDQVPPAHSAVKVGGVPSYKLARRDQAVALKARRVHIRRLDLVQYEYPVLEVRVLCSKGTYIRSLAGDVGRHLDCGAHVRHLRRCRVGDVTLGDSHGLEEIGDHVEASGHAGGLLTPPQVALSHLAAVELVADDARRFTHGAHVGIAAGIGESPCAVYDSRGALLGIAHQPSDADGLSPLCVVGDVTDV